MRRTIVGINFDTHKFDCFRCDFDYRLRPYCQVGQHD
jgi:hypothetical protein